MAIQVIREVAADVVKRGATKAVYAKQNDFNSRFLNVRIQEDGKDIVVEPHLTVMLNVERPDNQENMFYGTVNPDGTVKVPLTAWMLELAGTLVCDVSIVSEDPAVAKLTTMQFNIYVEAAVVADSGFVETEEYSVIVDLLNRTAEAEKQAFQAAADAQRVKEACEEATENAQKASERVVDELAKMVQLKPEFANSVEECTDTSKLYVLPDGYIYAYLSTTETVETYTNLLSSATDATGEVLNGVGYLEGKRWGSSATTFGDYKDGDTTLVGMVPFTLGQTLRIKGINVSSEVELTYTAFRGFDASRKNLVNGYVNLASYPNMIAATTIDATNNMITVHPTSNIYDNLSDKMRYIAFTVFPINGSENIIVTVDEEITDSSITVTKTEWTNTGRAFVPADYENRIIDLESDVSDLKKESNSLDNRISSLEASAGGSIPTYVLTEAEEVAGKVLAVRNAYSFVFGAISDIHSTGSDASTLHLGQGMYEIDKLTRLDACLNFGDGIDNYFENTNVDSFLHIHRCLHSVQREIPYIQMQGNHDQLKTDTTEDAQQKYFAYIGANNVGTVTDWDNRFRNYGYRDFPDQRMRVIYLNSVDVSEGENTDDCWLTAMQLSWLVNTALDFTDKNGWSFIVGCHHPLNWWYMDNLLAILNAYKGKASGSVTVNGTTVNYNFANATAEFIAHFHGHLHNFRAETLGSNGVLSITIPNACFSRNNEYGTSSSYTDDIKADYGDVDENGIQRQFNKTTGTADDTAFNIIVVDRDKRLIHCFNYGAGIDREINY